MMIKMLKPLSKSDIIEQMCVAYGGFFDRKESIHFNFPVKQGNSTQLQN